ncbi:gamma-glutamyl hydrolase A-like isoform X2 [Dreissena polymorpha]|uniref:folate gamma-glutamyl hydrolase n=1 Tax=Dreissena polymorpha TaxID=45954 RepID=A0A9D4RF54_DREPO|nr:gamma-glutamyl hydrolase A-like isoform X2 [Dreissena polymorpha]KAH3864030.1 hypothetical protein DPMN_027042 [Dreissena polymorpha]
MAMNVTQFCSFLLLLVPVYGIVNNVRPIIGVLAQESDYNDLEYGDTYISADYFQYIEMAGARAVPVFVRKDDEYYSKMVQSLNGILFPGGDVGLISSYMAKAAQAIYKQAIETNDAGHYFPLWGTCQGFQLLTALTAGKNLLTNASAEDVALPLDFVNGFRSSRLYGSLPADIYEYLSTMNVTENFHHYGITPETMELTDSLYSFYNILSTNLDVHGKRFVSSFEAKHYPFYGTQFHPEKVSFQWNTNYHINHGPEAIKVGQYFANFLVAEARKSDNHFAAESDEISAMIENYQPVFIRDNTYRLTYFFNYTSTP